MKSATFPGNVDAFDRHLCFVYLALICHIPLGTGHVMKYVVSLGNLLAAGIRHLRAGS